MSLPGPTLEHEAHLAAKEAEAREDPRFSRADANARRPRRDQATPAQGPQAPHSLMPRESDGRKRGRLSRSGDFDRVYRDGRSHSNRFLILYAFPREDDAPADGEDEVRLGVSVSRKVGGATERNAVKRALREAFWAFGDRLPTGYDFVLVARPDAAGLVEREGTNGAAGALGELFAASGIS
jgi:ribonuclease P protein component